MNSYDSLKQDIKNDAGADTVAKLAGYLVAGLFVLGLYALSVVATAAVFNLDILAAMVWPALVAWWLLNWGVATVFAFYVVRAILIAFGRVFL